MDALSTRALVYRARVTQLRNRCAQARLQPEGAAHHYAHLALGLVCRVPQEIGQVGAAAGRVDVLGLRFGLLGNNGIAAIIAVRLS